MEPLDREIAKALTERSPKKGPARVLVVGADGFEASVVDLLRDAGHRCLRVDEAKAAEEALPRGRFDIVLLNPKAVADGGAGLAASIQNAQPAGKLVMISDDTTADAVVAAMRCGAVDFIRLPADRDELVPRVSAALLKSRCDQERDDRLARLKRVCESLNEARHDVTGQLDVLCQDLVNAYQDISDQMSEVAMATEFRTLLRQELDVEDLLRTTLEYMLTKTGPTNAAVFLPDPDHGFGLGAYVNYDCPRDTVSMMLDRLCDAVCPQMAGESDIVAFDDAAEFAAWLDMETGVLAESQVVAFSCRHDDECLAVIVMFRSARDPFDPSLITAINTMRTIFAEQLHNIVRVHHRAEPQWPKDAVDDEMDFTDDFGFGGLAA